MERLLVVEGDGGVGSREVVVETLRCVQLALADDAVAAGSPERSQLVASVAKCIRHEDGSVRSLALEILSHVASAEGGGDADSGSASLGVAAGASVVEVLEAGAPGAAEGGRRGRGYAGFAVELVEALRIEREWHLKVLICRVR